MKQKLVAAIDQGTSSSRFILFNKRGQRVASYQTEFPQYYPQPGWVEHDPKEILASVATCVGEVMKDFDVSDITSLGITNQRETVVCWDSTTGEPLHNALVWMDTRTKDTVQAMKETCGGDVNYFRSVCGLPLSTYFSAMKIKWLMEHSEPVRKAIDEKRCMVGTVDSWLIWNLTGGAGSGKHVTDVTNASRTMLMELSSCTWHQPTLEHMGIPSHILPSIRSSSEKYGTVTEGILQGVPITGCLGDQQAAMVGQLCFSRGDTKNTYGTGCFMLTNTGRDVVLSSNGMLSTACFQLGPKAPVHYALEGSVAVAGAAIKWFRDNLQAINKSSEINDLASQVEDTGGVYFVPAFGGLLAPYWRDDARGTIVGMSMHSNKNHIARAILEATCFQTRDVLEAMSADSGVQFTSLKVDGGMTQSDLLCQMQSDLLGVDVVRPTMPESTALGAAIAAGLADGVDMWHDSEDVVESLTGVEQFSHVFRSDTSQETRHGKYAMWKKAVERSLGWVE